MGPFHLPLELLEITFYFFVVSRDFKRAMRLRLVNRSTIPLAQRTDHRAGRFKSLVDDTIFRHRMFHRLAWDSLTGDYGAFRQADCLLEQLESSCGPRYYGGPPHDVANVPLATTAKGRSQLDWLHYIYAYLSAQVALQDPASRTPLGRIRRAAEAVCRLDGGSDNGSEAVRVCIQELVPLAAAQWERGPVSRTLLLDRGPVPTEKNLQADVQTAAVWLGKTAYIKRLVAEGVRFCQPARKDYHSFRVIKYESISSVFEHPLRAAAMRGDIEMIQTILGALEPIEVKEGMDGDDERNFPVMFPEDEQQSRQYTYAILVRDGVKHGHREVVEFALETDEASCLPELRRSLHLTSSYSLAGSVREGEGLNRSIPEG
ncbi:ankyrin repeat-containing domain protein [Apiospora sp. TS-2023a]